MKPQGTRRTGLSDELFVGISECMHPSQPHNLAAGALQSFQVIYSTLPVQKDFFASWYLHEELPAALEHAARGRDRASETPISIWQPCRIHIVDFLLGASEYKPGERWTCYMVSLALMFAGRPVTCFCFGGGGDLCTDQARMARMLCLNRQMVASAFGRYQARATRHFVCDSLVIKPSVY